MTKANINKEIIMKNIVLAIMFTLFCSYANAGECVNGSCHLGSRVATVTREVVRVPVEVTRRTVQVTTNVARRTVNRVRSVVR